jgi:predicted patatin/cPLA2 family phospholipase
VSAAVPVLLENDRLLELAAGSIGMVDIRHPSGDVPSVLELIRSRAAGHSDDYTLALTVEGGGMRGVVSGAMLIALRDLGLAHLFDRFYGTSSGSMNLAYFAGGGGWGALSIYYDHLVSGFLRPRRLPHQPRMDMDFVFDEVIGKRVPLDTQQVAAAPYDIRIVLSDVEHAEPVIVQLRSMTGRLTDYLKAGAWLPILAGPPFMLDGRPYLDGGLLWPDPLYAALAEECTHVLMLNTAPEGTRNNTSLLTARILRRVLNHWRPGLGDAYLAGRGPWAVDKARLANRVDVQLRGVRVLRLCPPPGAHGVERMTVARDRLLDGARAGYVMISDVLGQQRVPAYFAVVLGE